MVPSCIFPSMYVYVSGDAAVESREDLNFHTFRKHVEER